MLNQLGEPRPIEGRPLPYNSGGLSVGKEERSMQAWLRRHFTLTGYSRSPSEKHGWRALWGMMGPVQ